LLEREKIEGVNSFLAEERFQCLLLFKTTVVKLYLLFQYIQSVELVPACNDKDIMIRLGRDVSFRYKSKLKHLPCTSQSQV
jgi:tryptophanyl-tRNA synthetase